MRHYYLIALICGLIFSILFLLLAPDEWKRYTICLFCIFSIYTLAMIGICVVGTK